MEKKFIKVEGAPTMGGVGAPGGFGAGPQPRMGFGGGATQAGGGGSQGGFGFRTSQQSQGQYAGSYGTRTPMHPSMTPMHHFGSGGGLSTPSHPGLTMTPMHAPYTPMHAPTPMDDNYHGGGGGGSGRAGGRGTDSCWGSMNAPTPGMHGMAYTPSAYGTAPTPGGMGDHHGEMERMHERGMGGWKGCTRDSRLNGPSLVHADGREVDGIMATCASGDRPPSILIPLFSPRQGAI